jgi:predicted Zn-dependent peptidase
MQYKKKTLKNGMRIIAVPMKDTNTVTVLSLVEAGSKYETKDKNGISHFLEHMCFKGTEKRPTAMDINRELDGLGAQSNAFTSEEFTGYYAKAEASHMERILDVISDMYLNPTFPKADMEKEKGVIIEEINMYEDLPQRKVGMLFMELMYGDEPAGWSIAGPKENILKMKRADFINYRKKHYVAEATTVIVAGKCDPDKVFKAVGKSFKDISTGKKSPKKKVKEIQNKPELLIGHKKTDQTHLILGFRAFDIFDKRSTTTEVMSAVLGAGMSSRLFHRLREEMGVCYYVRSSNDEYTDHGALAISTGVDKSRVEEVVKVLLEECARLRDELVGPEELKKTKDYMTGNLYLRLETSDSLAEYFGIQEIMKGKMKTPEELKKEIEKVTPQDIQKVAREIFKDDRLNLAIVGNISNPNSLKKILKLPSVKN